jgi:hypothetical protein
MLLFEHNKTGKKYIKVGLIINCTNAQDGESHTLYLTDTIKHRVFSVIFTIAYKLLVGFKGGKLYTRECNEFNSKFTEQLD